MEFRHDCVTAFFRLTLGGLRARVELLDVLNDDEPAGTACEEPAERLRCALADAKLS